MNISVQFVFLADRLSSNKCRTEQTPSGVLQLEYLQFEQEGDDSHSTFYQDDDRIGTK